MTRQNRSRHYAADGGHRARASLRALRGYEGISAIAKKHKLWVVEDNAQSIDAHGDGFKQGELSDAVCTSFIIQKNLGTLATAER